MLVLRTKTKQLFCQLSFLQDRDTINVYNTVVYNYRCVLTVSGAKVATSPVGVRTGSGVITLLGNVGVGRALSETNVTCSVLTGGR